MNRPRPCRLLLSALALGCGCVLAQPRSQALADGIASLRANGCAGHDGTSAPLRWRASLDDAARLVAQGTPGQEAARSSGYRATRLFQVHLNGQRSADAMLQALARGYCRQLTDAGLQDAGLYSRGRSLWIVLAAPFSPPPPSAAAEVAQQVLALANEARSQGRRCGDEFFPASAPLRQDERLARAAARHARDMASHGFVRHEGSDGSSPGERATRAGYRWRSVAENVAAGQTKARQVVRDWIRSPVHCAALMGAGFTDMGVAYAVDEGSEDGIYWSQTLARPQRR